MRYDAESCCYSPFLMHKTYAHTYNFEYRKKNLKWL